MSKTNDIIARALAAKAAGGAAGKQDKLISGLNIQTINGHDILKPGNLAIRTWQEFEQGWPTTGTTKSLCDAVNADATAVAGMGYMGECTFSDLPTGISNAEIQVEVYKGTGTSNKVLHLICTSGNVAPYRWELTYWNNGTSYSGWKEIGGGGSVDTLVTETTYAHLKNLRDNGQLIPGMNYRITDFVTMVGSQETEARSAGHQFDVIVQALTTRELSEDAKADYHYGDTYFKSLGDADFIPDLQAEDIINEYLFINGTESHYKFPLEFAEFGTDQQGRKYIAVDGGDFWDKYVYEGQQDYDGQTYDRWECINDTARGTKVVLTNIIIVAQEVINAILPAWELKYCLDNDTDRFAWACKTDGIEAIKVRQQGSDYIYKRDPSQDYQAGMTYWKAFIYVENSDEKDFDEITDWDNADINDVIFFSYYVIGGEDRDGTSEILQKKAPSPDGKGVVYYMKDEWNNECWYDFKNIQFKRYTCTATNSAIVTAFSGDYFGTKSICGGAETYPLNYTLEENDFTWYYTFNGLDTDAGDSYDMSIPRRVSEATIQFLINDGTGQDLLDSCHDNKIKPCHLQYMEDSNYNLGKSILNNIVMLGQFYDDQGQGDYPTTSKCYNNIFDPECHDMTFGNSTFDLKCGSYCSGITCADYCGTNVFGFSCQVINLGNTCYDNKFGDRTTYVELGDGSSQNIFRGNHWNINFRKGNCRNIIGSYASTLDLGQDSSYNKINSGSITFGASCSYNIIGEGSSSIKFGDNNSVTNYCSYNIIDSGVTNVKITTNGTSAIQQLQYVHIHSGIKNTIIVVPTKGQSYSIDYYANNSEEYYI